MPKDDGYVARPRSFKIRFGDDGGLVRDGIGHWQPVTVDFSRCCGDVAVSDTPFFGGSPRVF